MGEPGIRVQPPPSVRVARGATFLFAQGVVGNLAGVVYFAFAARLLPTVADMGRVSALGMVGGVFPVLATLSLPSAATRFVAKYVGEGREEMARAVFRCMLRVAVAAAGLSAVICLLASDAIAKMFLEDEAVSFLVRLLALDVFFLVLSPFLLASLYGLQMFREASAAGIVGAVMRNGVAILLLLQGMEVMGILVGWVMGDLVSTSALCLIAVRAFRGSASPHPLGELLRYSGPLYGSGILNYASSYVDRYIVLLLAGATTLGIYSPAVTAAGVVGVVSGSIGSALFPQLSEIYGRSGEDALRAASRAASRYVFLIYTPLAFGLAATAYPTIALFAGDRYIAGGPALAVISIGTALACASVVVNNVLLSIGSTRIFFEAALLAIALDTSVTTILLGPLGSTGAAIGRSALTIVLFLYPALKLRRMGQLDLDVDAFKKGLLASAVMLVLVVLLQLVWLEKSLLPAYIMVGGLSYLFILKALGTVKPGDLELVMGFLPKRLAPIVRRVGKLVASEGS